MSIEKEFFDRLVLQDILEYVANLVIYFLASNLYELEACLNKFSMPLKKDALALLIICNSVCYSPNDRLKKLESTKLRWIGPLLAFRVRIEDRVECGEHRRAKHN